MREIYLLAALLTGCARHEEDEADIFATAYRNGITGEMMVVKYIDKDRDRHVDLYGFGPGFETGSKRDPYGIRSTGSFFLSREYAKTIGFQGKTLDERKKTRGNPLVMSYVMEERVNNEFLNIRARMNTDGVAFSE